MFAAVKNLWRLLPGLDEVTETCLRETSFGYVIRTSRGAPRTAVMPRILSGLRAPVWVAAVAIWLVPLSGAGFAPRTIFCVGILAVVHVLIVLQSRGDASEIQVDTNRRELRLTTLSRSKTCLRRRIRFGEITAPELSTSSASAEHCLNLRIAGQDAPVFVAAGREAVIHAVYDRLMRDLRPIEERLASQLLKPRASRALKHPVFTARHPDRAAV